MENKCCGAYSSEAGCCSDLSWIEDLDYEYKDFAEWREKINSRKQKETCVLRKFTKSSVNKSYC